MFVVVWLEVMLVVVVLLLVIMVVVMVLLLVMMVTALVRISSPVYFISKKTLNMLCYKNYHATKICSYHQKLNFLGCFEGLSNGQLFYLCSKVSLNLFKVYFISSFLRFLFDQKQVSTTICRAIKHFGHPLSPVINLFRHPSINRSDYCEYMLRNLSHHESK